MSGSELVERDFRVVHPPPRARRTVVPNEVFGVLVFIFTEVMFFLGLISAHTITRGSWVVWPPPNQPRLPVEATAVTTLALLGSGVALWMAGRDPARRTMAYALSIVLGATFLAGQGFEWVRLLAQGLTFRSTPYASFFYLIVGAHALHVIGGLGAVAWMRRSVLDGTASEGAFRATRIFWYFVVLLWPILYWRVYL